MLTFTMVVPGDNRNVAVPLRLLLSFVWKAALWLVVALIYMVCVQIVVLSCFNILGWLIQIFFGFTFTDWYDYFPLLLLLFGVPWILSRWHRADELNTPPLWKPLVFLSFVPLLPTMALTRLAAYATQMLGHWPAVMVDDPKWLGGKNLGFDHWAILVAYADAYAGVGVCFFAALLLTEWRKLKPWVRVALCAGFAAALACDPGNVNAWWLN
jgi:hypothetical protein